MATMLLPRRGCGSVVSSLFRFRPSPSRFFSNSRINEADAPTSASEELKQVLESKIKRVKIFPERKEYCAFKRVHTSDGEVVLRGNSMGEKITIKGYQHLRDYYGDGEDEIKDEEYTSMIYIQIDRGNGRYIEFYFEAYTGINKIRFCDYDEDSDDGRTYEVGLLTLEIMEDPLKWLASKGVVCDISLAHMIEEHAKNDARHCIINWMKKLKEFIDT